MTQIKKCLIGLLFFVFSFVVFAQELPVCVAYSNYGSCQLYLYKGKYYSYKPELNNTTPQVTPTPAPTPSSEMVVNAGAKNVGVKFIVARKKDGTGNEKWVDKTYLEAVLKEASRISTNVNFILVSISSKNDDGLFLGNNQLPHLNLATRKASKKYITVAISGEKTTSSSGLAWVGYRKVPVFAMRSRFNGTDAKTPKAINNTAGIFVHELGHNMGLNHASRTSPIHTDNYTRVEGGLKLSAEYFKKNLKNVNP